MLETLIVAPLVPASEERLRFPLHVLVPEGELGGLAVHVAKVQLMRPMARSRLDPYRSIARVSARTRTLLQQAVARVFR